MNTLILGLLAESSIHPGAGQSAGIVDLPVAREAATDYPVIPGSSVKGALLSLARQTVPDADRKRIFGSAEVEGDIGGAGALLVADARLLLLPVRSLSTAYKWVTCPHLLERYQRDQQRAGNGTAEVTIPAISPGKYLGAGTDQLFLEERQFEHAGPLPAGLLTLIGPLIAHISTRDRLADQLILLHDDDFTWFARYGLAVQARNVLEEKKTSKNLWYEESLPADTLFYTLLAERGANAIAPVKQLFASRPYLQLGGNETVGMGWFAVSIPREKGGAA
jgi:CRISPR-associated protein Cmr4